jgi:hypothetical protein
MLWRRGKSFPCWNRILVIKPITQLLYELSYPDTGNKYIIHKNMLGIDTFCFNFCTVSNRCGNLGKSNTQSLLLRSMWEPPTVQHAIPTPSVDQLQFLLFRPDNPYSRNHTAKCSIYTPRRTAASTSRQPTIAEFGYKYEGCIHATVPRMGICGRNPPH